MPSDHQREIQQQASRSNKSQIGAINQKAENKTKTKECKACSAESRMQRVAQVRQEQADVSSDV